MQSQEVLKAAGSSCDIGSVCVYGGVSKWPQKEAKKVGVRRNYKAIMILPQTPTAEPQAIPKSSKKQPGRRVEVMGNSQSEGGRGSRQNVGRDAAVVTGSMISLLLYLLDRRTFLSS